MASRALALPRACWVPITAAIVLKPDFAAMFTRGLARLAGTVLGLLLATVLVHAVFGSLAGKVVLVGLLMFALRSVGAANYGLFSIAVTGLVVVLTALAETGPEQTIAERGMATLLGGALALAAYALWPTWERSQTPSFLADLLDAYYRYFAAVVDVYRDPLPRDAAGLDAARRAARVARTNAEASVARLRSEPACSAVELDRAAGILANSHRFVRSVMALEAGLYADPDPARAAPAPAALPAFSADIETTLRALAAALRDRAPLSALPDLRADLRAWPLCSDPDPCEGEPSARTPDRLAILASEADRITDSVNTLTRLVRGAVGTAATVPAPDPV